MLLVMDAGGDKISVWKAGRYAMMGAGNQCGLRNNALLTNRGFIRDPALWESLVSLTALVYKGPEG